MISPHLQGAYSYGTQKPALAKKHLRSVCANSLEVTAQLKANLTEILTQIRSQKHPTPREVSSAAKIAEFSAQCRGRETERACIGTVRMGFLPVMREGLGDARFRPGNGAGSQKYECLLCRAE